MNPKRIAILGGGPGGLMTAHLLQQRLHFPHNITIYEASPRLGGKIVTKQFETAPVTYEAGAAELYDYSQLGPDPLRELVAELDLTTRPMQGPTVILDDHILKSDADIKHHFGPETLRALQQFRRKSRNAISPAEYYESDWKQDNDDPLSQHSFRALLNQVKDPKARRYLEVAVHSDLATEPHLTSAMYGLQNTLMCEPDYMRLYTIDGGIEQLVLELAKRTTAKIRLRQPVLRVEAKSKTEYCVVSRDQGQIHREDFDFVVVALPNNWIPAIDWQDAILAEAMHRHHAYYDYPAHYLRVSILFEKPFWHDQFVGESYFITDAFGGSCIYDESSRNGCEKFGVLGWLLAGESALSMSNYDDATLIDQMLDSLPTALKEARSYFREGKVHRWVGAVNGLPAGHPAREPDSRHVPSPTEHPNLFVVGDYLFDSTINGVLDSADVAVDWIETIIKQEAEQKVLSLVLDQVKNELPIPLTP